MRAIISMIVVLLSGLFTAGSSTTVAAQDPKQMNEQIMPPDLFCDLIGKTTGKAPDQDAQMEALRRELRQLPAPQIEAFERAFQEQQKRAYSWDLWGAAYIMCGGASDDGFEYFQRWLISKGRRIFESAIADPDSLAETVETASPAGYDFELFAYVAQEVWSKKTGIDASTDPKGRFPYTGAPPAPQPSGEPFDEDPTRLAKRYPKLWARFDQ